MISRFHCESELETIQKNYFIILVNFSTSGKINRYVC